MLFRWCCICKVCCVNVLLCCLGGVVYICAGLAAVVFLLVLSLFMLYTQRTRGRKSLGEIITLYNSCTHSQLSLSVTHTSHYQSLTHSHLLLSITYTLTPLMIIHSHTHTLLTRSLSLTHNSVCTCPCISWPITRWSVFKMNHLMHGPSFYWLRQTCTVQPIKCAMLCEYSLKVTLQLRHCRPF